MPTKNYKPTLLEQRAAVWANDAQNDPQPSTIVIRWTKGREGWCARIDDDRGEKMAHAGGGGYCKVSTVLADVCRFLVPEGEPRRDVWTTSGTGPSSVAKALARHGWTLRQLTVCKNQDEVWQVERIKA